jgi:hypothetical protein
MVMSEVSNMIEVAETMKAAQKLIDEQAATIEGLQKELASARVEIERLKEMGLAQSRELGGGLEGRDQWL